MFSNLTYKQKFFAVIGCFLLLFLACYKKTFRGTITAGLEYYKQVDVLNNTQNTDLQLAQTQYEINEINKAIGSNEENLEQVQQQILDFINQRNLNVFSVAPVHVFNDEKFNIYTNQIEITGEYTELIKVLYDFEKYFKKSRISSTVFYTKKNYQNNTKKLHLKFILQNYANKN